MNKLYWGKHTCAIGTHVLLEEIGQPYATEEVDVAGGATHRAPFNRINPKEKVPVVVRDDGAILTEFGAIAVWLARGAPQANLLPADADSERTVIEVMDYVVGTIHGLGFGRIFKPEVFEPQDAVHGSLGVGKSSVQKQGRAIVQKGFELLDLRLGRSPYVAGEGLSIADAALFYTERWAPRVDIELPANLRGHFERMKQRRAVHAVMEFWGEV